MEQHRYLNVNVDSTMTGTHASVHCDASFRTTPVWVLKATRHDQHLSDKAPVATVTPLYAHVMDQRQSHLTNMKSLRGLDCSQNQKDET